METLTQKGLSMILYMSQDMEINSTQKKNASTLSVFKSKVKSWSIHNRSCRLCIAFVEDFGFVEVCLSL